MDGLHPPLEVYPMTTLLEAFNSIPDHRKPQGLEYKLSSLLLLVTTGFLCGCDSMLAVWRFANRLSREQREALGLLWFKVPSNSRLTTLLGEIDVSALEAALSQLVLAQQETLEGDGEKLQLMIDGKALRGSRRKAMPKGAQMLACFSDRLGGVIGQKATKGGYDEVTAAIAVLKSLPPRNAGELPLKGTVVTGDAMFADRQLCETIVEQGGDYVFPLKDNKPSLKQGALKALEKKR